jgi:hypothetical protein
VFLKQFKIEKKYLKSPVNQLIKQTIFLLVCLQINTYLAGQQYLPLNSETNLRFEKSHYKNSFLHSNVRPFMLSDSIIYDESFANDIGNKLLDDNLYETKRKEFSVYINPILTIAPSFDIDSSKILNNYQLGISVGGKFKKKVAFRFDGFYGIVSFPSLSRSKIDSTEIVPGFGEYLKADGENYHYLSVSGHLSYSPWRELNLQAGIGKNFFGEGYRSLFLSDNSASYPFVKATVDIWKFKYIWMFGALKEPDLDRANNKLQNKLLFTHYLSWNATKWLNLNFFEAIVSNPVDSMGVSYFNINYLNPVIFFRPTEFSGGSADNALLGLGGKIKLWKKYHFYSQVIIDEFVLSELRSGNDWWGNKYGIQAGLKVFDLLNIENLFGRIEYNLIRPYTYSYSNSINNYGSHYQPLAHPSGANVEELVAQIHYHKNRYSFELKGVFAKAGLDTDSVSYGKDIYKSYELRPGDYGNLQGQGSKAKFFDISFNASYFLNPKMGLQINFSINYQKHQLSEENLSTSYISLGIKTLIFDNTRDFL